MMRRLQYNTSNQVIRLEYPETWTPEDLTGIHLDIDWTDGTSIEADEDVTLWTVSTITEPALAGDITIYVNVLNKTQPVPNDELWIAADNTNDGESVTVSAISVASNIATITLKSSLQYNHADNCVIVSRFATYTLTTASTTDYPEGQEIILTWKPLGLTDGGDQYRELCKVVKQAYDESGAELKFRALYPREYDALTDPTNRFSEMYAEARAELTTELLLRGIKIDNVVDTELLGPTLRAKLRWLVLLSGDDRYDAERTVAMQEYTAQFERLATAPIWTDDNADSVKDDGEEDSHEAAQWVGCERGI